MDVRCPSKKHAEIITPAPGGVIEIKCDSRYCGAGNGAVVLHRFDTQTGAVIGTQTYRNPRGTDHGTH